MPKIKLTYFDFHGGRGEAARIAMSIGGVAFEDHRVNFAEWPALKPETPFGQLPVLEVDGKRISQSNAINRYVGKLAGLYPEDPWQAALADEVCEAIEAFYAPLGVTMRIKDPVELERARKELVDGPIPQHMSSFAKMLANAGGEWFADRRLTIADLKAYECVRHLSSGRLDHIPTDLVARLQPTLGAHFTRVREHPGVAAYYQRVQA